MPPACALLAMVAPAFSEKRPIGFMDLPVEIRCLVHKLLPDRRVDVRIPGMVFSGHLIDRLTEVINCFYPNMARVNKKVSTEYTSLVMPHMILRTDWAIISGRVDVGGANSRHRFLPTRIFSQLKLLDLTAFMHLTCPKASLSSVVSRICAVFCDMPLLSFISFKAVFYSDGISQQTLPREFSNVALWKHDITDTFEAFANYASLTVEARFVITCPLYCRHATAASGTVYDPLVTRIPPVTFAVCNGPDKDTFELHGLNVKFMGIDKDRSVKTATHRSS